MDDLIRREDVLRIIRDGWNNHYSCKDMCDEIKELPTAYNVDKVLEQIDKEKGHLSFEQMRIEKAKEIVKAGGVNEN